MKLKSSRAKIEELPNDLIGEVVGQLVSHSPTPISDLDNLRITCKTFHAASKEKSVGRRIAIEKERWMQWWDSDRYNGILEHCAKVGNPEACFLLGLKIVFDLGDVSVGLGYLRKAVEGGHVAALYTVGIVLFGYEKEEELGMEYLKKFEALCNCHAEVEDAGVPQVERYRRKALDAIRLVTWRRWSGMKRERCTIPWCGGRIGWDNCKYFCSESCKWSCECFEFYEEM
ncbi:F-box protein At2g35280-like [Typha latifolia]|uniref:F-box protein At2g35280-like n=1 Tax=Typha latifolia TaxID=4733 RepID=UPI003C2D925A